MTYENDKRQAKFSVKDFFFFSTGNFMLKVNVKTWCEIYSKLIIKTK